MIVKRKSTAPQVSELRFGDTPLYQSFTHDEVMYIKVSDHHAVIFGTRVLEVFGADEIVRPNTVTEVEFYYERTDGSVTKTIEYTC